eukprot:scaffold1225_cov199-Alexandrium_tamarense.AAC.3
MLCTEGTRTMWWLSLTLSKKDDVAVLAVNVFASVLWVVLGYSPNHGHKRSLSCFFYVFIERVKLFQAF